MCLAPSLYLGTKRPDQEQAQLLAKHCVDNHSDLPKQLRSLPRKVVLLSACSGTGLFEMVAVSVFEELGKLCGRKFEARAAFWFSFFHGAGDG
jgi:hypothetical protein